MTPSARRLRAELGAHTKWATETDRPAATAAARRTFLGKFIDQADPDGVTRAAITAARAAGEEKRVTELEAALAGRVQHARQAHMKRLALASVKARAARKAKSRKASGAPPPSTSDTPEVAADPS